MGERNAGKFDMNVQKDEKVPETQISTSSDKLEDIVLTAEEKKQMEAGTDVKIVLDVKDASYVSSTDKTLVETALNSNTAAKGFAVGQYLASVEALDAAARSTLLVLPAFWRTLFGYGGTRRSVQCGWAE